MNKQLWHFSTSTVNVVKLTSCMVTRTAYKHITRMACLHYIKCSTFVAKLFQGTFFQLHHLRGFLLTLKQKTPIEHLGNYLRTKPVFDTCE